ncbi:MAG TPA: hypothetical protein VE980_16975 [Pyrinomonadaceae bacterium]|nr:hypothetical protein [Pyrinomonadaceae bacterium]
MKRFVWSGRLRGDSVSIVIARAVHYHLPMKLTPLASTILLLLCFSAHAQTVSPDDGAVQEGEYINRFFNFAFRYPKDWVVHDKALNERIHERAKEEAAKSGNLAQLKDAYPIFTASRYARGQQRSGLNPTILLVAERVSGNPDGKDYLLSLRPLKMKRGAQPLLNEPVEFSVAGLRFFRDDYSAEVQGVSLRSAIFVTVKKGYALVFSFTGQDEKSLEEMAETMKTILPLGRGGNGPD